jgi:hypothetical protein
VSTKKRQPQTLDEIWNLFVEACGSKCCVCLRAGQPLYRGHILRYEDSRDDRLANLLPICKGCNSKYSRNPLTPDNRPVDWQSRFIKRLISQWDLSVHVREQFEQVAQVGQAQPANSTRIATLDEIDFARHSVLPVHVPRQVPAAAPTAEEIGRAVTHILRLGRDHVPSVPLPKKSVRGAMEGLALRGIAQFVAAGREFIHCEDFVSDSGHSRMPYQEWQNFCDNFDIYVQDAEISRQRETKERAEAMDAEKLRQAEEARLASDPEHQRRLAEAAAKHREYNQRRKRRYPLITSLVHQFEECGQQQQPPSGLQNMYKSAGDDSDETFSARMEAFEKLLLETRHRQQASVEAPDANLRSRRPRNRGKKSSGRRTSS